jgi:hypothetical protein
MPMSFDGSCRWYSLTIDGFMAVRLDLLSPTYFGV